MRLKKFFLYLFMLFCVGFLLLHEQIMASGFSFELIIRMVIGTTSGLVVAYIGEKFFFNKKSD